MVTSTLCLEMCDYCSHTLKTVSIKHGRLECPYRRSMYCPVCVGYGHAPATCPNKVAWALRSGKMPTEANLELRVVDTEEAMRALLKSNGIQPGSKKENKKMLRDLANSMQPPRMIIFTK